MPTSSRPTHASSPAARSRITWRAQDGSARVQGTQAFYSSGWLSDSNDFVVKLDPNLKPGAYRFICLLHGPDMTETVNIVDKAAKADTADDVKARMNDQLKTFQDALSKQAAESRRSRATPSAA